jgi:membrane protein YqaA with SNARE-associated domain
MKYFFKRIQDFINRPWYEWLLGFLAGLDHFIVVVPTDGLLISSALLAPKKWVRLAVLVSLGSTLGAMLLGAIVKTYGSPWLESHFPELLNSQAWQLSTDLFSQYGLYFLFAVAATPIVSQPVVILTALSDKTLINLFFVMLAGRLLKYFIMAATARWAPQKLSKLWGVQAELKEVQAPQRN